MDESTQETAWTGTRFREANPRGASGARFRRDPVEDDGGEQGSSGSRFRFTLSDPDPSEPVDSTDLEAEPIEQVFPPQGVAESELGFSEQRQGLTESSHHSGRTWPDIDRRHDDRRSGDERRHGDRRAQLSHEPMAPVHEPVVPIVEPVVATAIEPVVPTPPDPVDRFEVVESVGDDQISYEQVVPVDDREATQELLVNDEPADDLDVPEGGWPLPRSSESRPSWLDHDPFVRNEDLPWADDDVDTPGFSSSQPFVHSDAAFDPTDIAPVSMESLSIEPLEVDGHIDVEPDVTANGVEDFDALFPRLDSATSAARFETSDDTFSVPAFPAEDADDAGSASDMWDAWPFASDSDVDEADEPERYDEAGAQEYGAVPSSQDWGSSFADLQNVDDTFNPHRADPWGDDERTTPSPAFADNDWLPSEISSDDTYSPHDADRSYDETLSPSVDHEMPPKGARSLTGMNDVTQPWWLQDVDAESVSDVDALPQEARTEVRREPLREQVPRDFYADDEEEDDGYGDLRRRQPSDFFDEDADLDEPDEYEIGDDDWAFADEDEDEDMQQARRQQREPRDARSRRPAPRSPRSRPAPQSNFQMPSIFNDRSKLTVIVAVVLVIIVLSTVGKDLFAKVAAATDPNGISSGMTCATVDVDEDGSDSSRSGLGTNVVAPPPGWTIGPDHEANTGAVDFSKALRNEPDVGSALAILDSSRFQRGYNRTFEGPGNLSATVAVYQFAAPICAEHYVSAHDGDVSVVSSFEVPEVDGARGVVREQSDGSLVYIVRVARGDRAVTVTWQGDPSPARAVVGAIDLARGQWSTLQ